MILIAYPSRPLHISLDVYTFIWQIFFTAAAAVHRSVRTVCTLDYIVRRRRTVLKGPKNQFGLED